MYTLTAYYRDGCIVPYTFDNEVTMMTAYHQIAMSEDLYKVDYLKTHAGKRIARSTIRIP